jgi:hypothetical protein
VELDVVPETVPSANQQTGRSRNTQRRFSTFPLSSVSRTAIGNANLNPQELCAAAMTNLHRPLAALSSAPSSLRHIIWLR